jgi:hypothetical protein
MICPPKQAHDGHDCMYAHGDVKLLHFVSQVYNAICQVDVRSSPLGLPHTDLVRSMCSMGYSSYCLCPGLKNDFIECCVMMARVTDIPFTTDTPF